MRKSELIEIGSRNAEVGNLNAEVGIRKAEKKEGEKLGR